MTFDQFNFIQGQSVQGDINPAVDPFLYAPPEIGYYPNKLFTYPQLPVNPLDLFPVNKEKLDASVKEKKKKRRRKKLLKLMILSQMMNNNN